jgi:carbamoyl-phosphate synthase small subunit
MPGLIVLPNIFPDRATKTAILALADGTIFKGLSIGADGHCVAEVVFNTAMTGYQEIYTDPSYHGQLLVHTLTHRGKYGTLPSEEVSTYPNPAPLS